MRYTFAAIPIFAAILAVSGIGAAPQSSTQSTPTQNQSQTNQTQPGMMMHKGLMGQSGMGGGMGTMGQMSSHHQRMTTLMNKLMQSMTAIQSEKDPAALKSKLAEHETLLKQMRAEMMQQGAMMKNMSSQMQANCPAMANQ